MSRRLYVLIVPLLLATSCLAQEAGKKKFNRQDHLRGAVTPEREWWDVQHYHLTLEVFPEAKSIKGSNLITFKVIKAHDRMQIDLQEPLSLSLIHI